MADPDRPPRLLFVHEWWLQLRDDLKLAGALFNCFPTHDPQMPSKVELTMFDQAEAALLTAIARGALPQTTHQIIYGIWFEPEDDWQPMLGPVLNDPWLAPLRDGVGTPDRVGSVQIIAVKGTDDDRRSDPQLEGFPADRH
jgi:hypothetical protein